MSLLMRLRTIPLCAFCVLGQGCPSQRAGFLLRRTVEKGLVVTTVLPPRSFPERPLLFSIKSKSPHRGRGGSEWDGDVTPTIRKTVSEVGCPAMSTALESVHATCCSAAAFVIRGGAM